MVEKCDGEKRDMTEKWKCPDCGLVQDKDDETTVYCEDCGEHPALRCQGEHCDTVIDLIYTEPDIPELIDE